MCLPYKAAGPKSLDDPMTRARPHLFVRCYFSDLDYAARELAHGAGIEDTVAWSGTDTLGVWVGQPPLQHS